MKSALVVLVTLFGGCRARKELPGNLQTHDGAMYVAITGGLDKLALGDVLPIRVAAVPDETFLGQVDRRGVRVISHVDALLDGMPATILVRPE